MDVYNGIYPENQAGGFTRLDGTIQFFARVNALLRPEMTVLDFGAGRGLIAEDKNRFRRELGILHHKVAKVIAVDVDDAVLENRISDEQHVFDGTNLPIADRSVDLIVADHVLEHVGEPQATAAEIDRVLKPGGWFCARTPYSYSMLASVTRLIPNRSHANLVKRVQPGGRESKDVFPTRYRLNSFRALKKYFPKAKWDHHSYTWTPEPGYHFGSPTLVRLLRAVQYAKAPVGGEVLLVFLRKK